MAKLEDVVEALNRVNEKLTQKQADQNKPTTKKDKRDKDGVLAAGKDLASSVGDLAGIHIHDFLQLPKAVSSLFGSIKKLFTGLLPGGEAATPQSKTESILPSATLFIQNASVVMAGGELPSVELPQAELPPQVKAELPKMEAPSEQKLELPKIETPLGTGQNVEMTSQAEKLQLPKMEVPFGGTGQNVEITGQPQKLELPKVEVPKQEKLELPKMETPSAEGVGDLVTEIAPEAEAAGGILAEGGEAAAGAAAGGTEAALGAAGATGAAGAAGGAAAGTEALAGGAAAGVAGIAAIPGVDVIAAVVAAAVAIPAAFLSLVAVTKELATSFLEMQRQFSEGSGDMAEVFAKWDVFQTMFNAKIGDTLAPTTSVLEESLEDFMTTLEPYIIGIYTIVNVFLIGLVEIVNFIVRLFEETMLLMAKGFDALTFGTLGVEKSTREILAHLRKNDTSNDATEWVNNMAREWDRRRALGDIGPARGSSDVRR